MIVTAHTPDGYVFTSTDGVVFSDGDMTMSVRALVDAHAAFHVTGDSK